MTIDLFPKFKPGDRVRLRPAIITLHAQYLPAKVVGIVKASYMMPNGVRLREELDVLFGLTDPVGATVEVEMRAIAAENVERA